VLLVGSRTWGQALDPGVQNMGHGSGSLPKVVQTLDPGCTVGPDQGARVRLCHVAQWRASERALDSEAWSGVLNRTGSGVSLCSQELSIVLQTMVRIGPDPQSGRSVRGGVVRVK
jgi:hypothetical protein